MSRKKSFIINLIIISFGTVLPRLAAFITLPILTAELTKKEYGMHDNISTLVSLFLPVVTLQIQTAAFRFLIDYRGDEKKTNQVLSNIICFVIPTSIVSLGILYLCMFKIDPLLRLVICLYFYFDIMLRTLQQIVRGMSNNKLYSVSSVLESLLNLGLVVATVKMGKMGLMGVIISIAVADFVAVVIILARENIFGRIKFSYVSKKMLKEMLAYSWPMIPNALSIWVLKFSDRMVLTLCWGTATNAIYAAATKIPSVLNVVQNSFTFAWQENASIVSEDEDADRYYSNMFDSIYTFLAGMLALLIAATPIMFKILIKGNYEEAYYQMPILFMGTFFSCITAFLGGIYVAKKKTKSVGITTVVCAVINLAIDLIFVKQIRVYAASISTLVSYMALAIFRMIDVQKFQKIEYNIRKIVFYLAALSGMCILCFVNNFYINILNFVIGCLFALITNRKMISGMLNMIKKKRGKA